jgi:aldehyde dehydrogenase (NAD+)
MRHGSSILTATISRSFIKAKFKFSILAYRDEEEAIRLANASDHGVHAYVFSSNVPRANAVAARLEAGRVMVNTLQNDALAPFGGYKQSGFGREFGLLGLESFLEPKAIIGN